MSQISFLKSKITIHSILAFMLVIFGFVMVMIALYMPPKGEIHATVITVFGMLLAIAGACIGLDLNFQLRSFLETLHDHSSKIKADETHQ